MKRIIIALLVTLLVMCSCEEVYRYTNGDFYSMSTYVSIISEESKDFGDIEGFASDFESRVSRTRDGSEISNLNDKGTAVFSEDTLYILKRSLEISINTDGAFNPCMGSITELWDITSGKNYVPDDSEIQKELEACDISNVSIDGGTVTVADGTRIDLGGVAKGYALQKMLELECEGVSEPDVCINLGGNVGARGTSESNKKKNIYGWNVGITNPFDKNEIIGTLLLKDGFIAISGAYERFFEKDGNIYHHIFDPKTGKPSESDLMSVAIVNKNGLEGDALSTALFVMGKDEAVEFYKEGKYDFDMLLVTNDGKIYVSEGIYSLFTLESQAKDLNGQKMTIIKVEK